MDRLRPEGKENGKREIVERNGNKVISKVMEKFRFYYVNKT